MENFFKFKLSPSPHLVPGRKINDIKNKIKKTKNSIFAIPTAAPAMPVKPNTPAISAIIKKTSVQPNIKFLSQLCL
jgi:hypothetical protein